VKRKCPKLGNLLIVVFVLRGAPGTQGDTEFVGGEGELWRSIRNRVLLSNWTRLHTLTLSSGKREMKVKKGSKTGGTRWGNMEG